MTRGKALKSGGAAPQTPFPESGGGSWQKSHGDPCCGAREPGKVQVIKKKKNVNRGLKCIWLQFKSSDSQFEIRGKEGSQAAAPPTQRTPLPLGQCHSRLAHLLLICDVRAAILNVAKQTPWFEWLFCQASSFLLYP